MKHMILLGLLGAVPLAFPRPAPEIIPIQVKTETIRVIPLTIHSFSSRWRPVEQMPEMVVAQPLPVPRPEVWDPPPKAKVRPTSRPDICSRHGMRKVMVGKYRWRCRR